MKQPFTFGRDTTEEFRRVREVFESALQKPVVDRPRFVEEACAGDPFLISEVQRMLEADTESYSLLDEGRFGEAQLNTGSIFADHIEILGTLGRGGMGEVYHGRDTNLQRHIALKILPAAFTRDPERLARFRREAQLLASLNHPNIGPIYSFEEADGVQALALELVEGPTLADRIAQGPIPVEEAVPIARQIAEALEAAHEQGIVHRDLKPANVKLRPDGAVKVLDFGLAKALQIPDSASTEAPEITSPAMLAMGVMIGTPAYMSPEQARGRAADRRADIWAFGAVFYEMLAGKRAFRGQDVADTLASVLRQEIDWSALPSTTPEAIRSLIARCLDRDPKQRLRDIGEARILLSDPGSRAHVFSNDVVPRNSWNRQIALWLLAAAAVSGIAGAGILYLGQRKLQSKEIVRLALVLPEG